MGAKPPKLRNYFNQQSRYLISAQWSTNIFPRLCDLKKNTTYHVTQITICALSITAPELHLYPCIYSVRTIMIYILHPNWLELATELSGLSKFELGT
jgi:hypothetical protein